MSEEGYANDVGGVPLEGGPEGDYGGLRGRKRPIGQSCSACEWPLGRAQFLEI